MSESPFLGNRERIFENSIGFVIFDKFPVSKGHCLIIPNRIYSNYFDSSEEEIIGLNKLLFKTKKYLDEKFNPSGFNVGINCGKVSGQTVDHLHIHIIPRYPKDVDDPTGGVRCVIPNKQKYK
ncbi:HIT family protein [Rickettsiales bacterium]|nr:HIT family protein [Rickettsiales bacterium]